MLAGATAGGLVAGNLSSFTAGDVLLGFRKSGVSYDLVVDLGQISTFTNASANQRINLTQYTGNQLALVGTNGVNWSAFAYFDSTVTPASVQGTLFASNPRPALNVQSGTIPQHSNSSQNLVINKMKPVSIGANENLTHNGLNASRAVLEPDDSSNPNYNRGQS